MVHIDMGCTRLAISVTCVSSSRAGRRGARLSPRTLPDDAAGSVKSRAEGSGKVAMKRGGSPKPACRLYVVNQRNRRR